MNSRRMTIVLAVVFGLSPATVAYATKYWKTAVTSGNWSGVNNWSATSQSGADNAGPPVASEPVVITHTNGTAHTVTLDTNTPSLGLVYLDLTGAGTAANTLSITANQNLTAAAIGVGGHNGSAFTNGRGAVNQANGTVTISPGADLILAWGAGSTGTYTLSGGSLVANQTEWIGYAGTGTLNHTGGTNTINASGLTGLIVGFNSGTTGTYNLSGTGALLSNEDQWVGYNGIGMITQTGGSNTIQGAGNHLYLGYNAGATGTYTISAGTLSAANDIVVGNSGTGTLTIQSTGSVSTNGLSINSTSNVNLNGGTLRFNTIGGTGGLSKLNYTAGTIQLAGDRTIGTDTTISTLFGTTPIIPSGKGLAIESNAFIETDVNVQGGTFAPQYGAWVGDSGTGTLTISNGGTLSSGSVVIGRFGSANGSVTVTDAGSSLILSELDVGYNGTGELTVANGASVSSFYSYISRYGGLTDTGTATVTGIGSTWTNSILWVGDSGKGDLTILDGGSASGIQTVIGANSSAAGSSLTVSGTGSSFAASESFGISRGTITIEAGATVTSGWSAVGVFTNGDATALVTDPGSSWTTNELRISSDNFNLGELTVTNGGSVSSTVGYLGDGTETNGTVTVGGTASLWSLSDSLYVGGDEDSAFNGTGTLNVGFGGTVNVADTTKVWDDGTINLTGGTINTAALEFAGSTFNFTSGTLHITGPQAIDSALLGKVFGTTQTISTGRNFIAPGTATLTQSLTLDGGSFTVGQLVNASFLDLQRGTLVLSNQAVTIGAGGLFGSTLDLNDDVTVNVTLGITNQGLVMGDGQIGGTFANAATGELRAEPGKSLKLTGANNTNSGQISLYGGMLDFTQNLTNNVGAFISGNGTLKAATGITNQGTMNFAGTANIDGAVTNAGGGKIISGGGGATIFYDDVTNNGEIRTSTNGFTIFFGAVSGSGTFTGTGTVNFEGDLSPGSSPAAVNFAGDVALGPDASLQIEIGGTSSGSQHDQLIVAGDLSLDGALEVSLINGFNPSAGQTFNILDWLGTRTGTFSSLALPTLAGLAWNTSQLYTTGVLSVAPAGVPGDYNNNGTVDAADYVLWRKGGPLANEVDTPGTVNAADYTAWRARFGNSGSGSGATAGSPSSAIPEPASLILLVSLSPCLLLFRRVAKSHS